ncbi:hypothetical protein LIER_37697 [Lithospermum erythrorhizon]|uniref:DYW domain-containing protein n=1 Tax=Lithospermum erythrorhizon TaxID=34254 RepID=A0AAV3PRK5_LITER
MAKSIISSYWCTSSVHLNKKREKSPKTQNGIALLSKKLTSRSNFLSSSTTPIACGTIFSLNSAKVYGTKTKILDINHEIWKFCNVGNLQKAMKLLFMCEKSELDIKSYCNVLQLCAEVKCIEDGKKVHSFIENNGVEVDGVLGSKLVFMYVKCGDLREGRRVFDEVANEKVFLWNMLMNEYAHIGDYKESVDLFCRMIEFGVEPNAYSFSCILKYFGALGSVENGEFVHGCLLKLGFGSDTTVVNSLIAFYFKCGRVESGVKLFGGLCYRDIISWNTMISGYVANGISEKGLEVFVEMLSLGVEVDLATMLCILACCADIESLLVCKAIHCYAAKAGFGEVMKFENTLLDVYSKCGDLDSAIRVFENMSKRSIVSWTSMLSGYARVGKSDKAIQMFHEMVSEGMKPDAFTITRVIHACACSGSLEDGKELHHYVKENGMESSLAVCNALTDMFAKYGSMQDALLVFSSMEAKDIVSWNSLIGGYSKNNQPNEALSLFLEMQDHTRPDGVTVTCILPACASLAALNKGREVHGYILRNGLSTDRFVANALVDMYVKCGALAIAVVLFDMIRVKDLVSCTVMIAGYAMHGFGNEAIATFNKMRQAGVEPTEASFTSILSACTHSGLVEEGWTFFHGMKNECKIDPRLEHYGCMVDLLSRTGRLSEAYKFTKSMPLKPDATIWGALLCGCRMHHDVKLAEQVADHLLELEPENTEYYVLLANTYEEADKWQEIKQLRHKIEPRWIKNRTGCSWIEIKGKVHIFDSSGNGHPEAMKIEFLLKSVRRKMEEQGCSSKLKYTLVNADERQKETSICGHSEKLAMAFGILNLQHGKTIRVTKNSRVCGDCHEMAKFISRNLGREILLRDSNRFHQFKDGSCSCRG